MGETRSLIIVDDDPHLRKIAGRLLEMRGVQVVELSTAAEVLETLDAGDRKIDALIIDLMMPHMDGMELLLAVRKRGFDLPVIICSGSEALSDITLVPEVHGDTAVLSKPFYPDQVLAELDALFSRR